MLRTIQIGTCIFIQGEYVKTLADGRMVVRLGQDLHVGHPVEAMYRQAA